MDQYLAVFTGGPDGMAAWQALDDATRAQREQDGLAAWGRWMQDHAADIVETGGPLGKTKRVTPGGIADIRNNLAGYVVVRAASHEAAARLFEGHPHFTIFPGDGVEVMPLLPIPGQK